MLFALFFIADVFSQNAELPRRFDSKAFNLPIVHSGFLGGYSYSDGTPISKKSLDKILASVEGNDYFLKQEQFCKGLAWASLAAFCGCLAGACVVAAKDGNEDLGMGLLLGANLGAGSGILSGFGAAKLRILAVENYNMHLLSR